ncbi:Na+/H+ antiporter subunit E [Ammoniphilus sp. CFH 90114]|uniref:Na+/H+ antiporter subunit E n=1 Tax=Ammoniphilus sp. CFH 90114 TaxID=2493665 RepID=UPI00100EF593|nr:Na+/H+ antiporter subunit E [Ammoniphilus sp. CFH 90114]RXT08739.1 Na+/H+ antiporter subunit E [Ammoniphilus sp. CFH 90114]
MAVQVLLNFLLAFIWMFLNQSWDPVTFILGYIIGLGLIYFLHRFLQGPFYFKRVIAIVSLILLFIKELILSSISVIKLILRPNMDFRPGIFALPTDLKSDWEITLLASLITLTPGTLTLEVSPKGDTLYIHAMDLPDTQEAISQIKNSFERAIKEVTR